MTQTDRPRASQERAAGSLEPSSPCYVVLMTTISHRAMRNGSSEVLRRAEAGGEFVITNHGQPVARLGPITGVLRDLADSGQARPARASWESLEPPTRMAPVSSAEVLADLRHDW